MVNNETIALQTLKIYEDEMKKNGPMNLKLMKKSPEIFYTLK